MNRYKWNLPKCKLIFLAIIVLLFLFKFCYRRHSDASFKVKHLKNNKLSSVHIALVSCARLDYQNVRYSNKAVDQSVTMMKSAIATSNCPIYFHVFTESDMKLDFESELETWPEKVLNRINVTFYDINYERFVPKKLGEELKVWYKPCGSYRLFTPMLLDEVGVGKAIYVDNDILFVRSVSDLWSEFDNFDKHQVMGIAPTSGETFQGSDSNEFSIKSKENGFFQINSGVLLFDIRKMLGSKWKLDKIGDESLEYGKKLILKYYFRYKNSAEHDQKLLNIIFHYNPELLRPISCRWNFKNNMCSSDGLTCPDAESFGAGVVHGISSSFFGDVNPTFRALYECFLNFDFIEDDLERFLDSYLQMLDSTAVGTYCYKKHHTISLSLSQTIDELKSTKL